MTAPAHQHHHGAPAALEPSKATPAWRLLFTLGLAGAAAGLLVVMVYRLTLPTIQRYAAIKADAAVREVLAAPARWDTLYLVKGALVATLPAGADPRELTKAFVGRDSAGARTGVAVIAEGPGFQEILSLMVGFDPATGALVGIKVLDQKETPGLGDKIETDPAFLSQFLRLVTPVTGAKTKSGDKPNQVQTITGATISSRAVIRIVNRAVERWRPLLQAYDKGATP
jgi:electron transport complex protein RnfG